MAQDKDLTLVIWAGILLIVGVILSSAIGDYTHDATTLSSRVNETNTMATRTTTLSNDDVTSISYIGNGSRDLSAFINTIGFNYTDAGVITTNGTFANGLYNISYNFEGDAYINHSTSRTLIRLIPIFFVLGVLAVAVFFGIRTMKENGWL